MLTVDVATARRTVPSFKPFANENERPIGSSTVRAVRDEEFWVLTGNHPLQSTDLAGAGTVVYASTRSKRRVPGRRAAFMVKFDDDGVAVRNGAVSGADGTTGRPVLVLDAVYLADERMLRS